MKKEVVVGVVYNPILNELFYASKYVCFVLFCFVLFCFVLFCFVLFCFVLFCFVLFCFVLFCFVLFCFILRVINARCRGGGAFLNDGKIRASPTQNLKGIHPPCFNIYYFPNNFSFF